MKKLLVIAVCVLSMSAPLYAKEVTSVDIVSDLPQYIGKTVTMTGVFIYSEPMRESFTVDQNSRSIEIFYRDLSRREKDFILAQKHFSRTPITVIGVVQPYTNRKNVFFLNATSLPVANGAPERDAAAPLYAKEMTSEEVLSDLAHTIGRTVTMSGVFIYSEPMRESFTLDQNSRSIEVFYRDLQKNEKKFILAQKNFSKAPITVTGVVQPYTNRPNAFFLNAISLPAANNAPESSVHGVSIHYSDIVSDPTRYLGKEVALEGLFIYSEPMRESFTIEANGNSIEVFYRDLAQRDKDLVLSQKNRSKVPVTVTGTLQQFTNKAGAYFINASSVNVGQ